jgi:ATP-dependent exoDNAse (exonuclease V) beta subunit
MKIKIISAGAGSGKTFRLTQEMTSLLSSGKVRASGIIATTFTKKAAAELQERVRVKLLEEGLPEMANELSNALIGTVHSLGVKLLKRFAFEAGVSPQSDIMAQEDQQLIFNQSLSMVLTSQRIEEMERLATRLGFYKDERAGADWRTQLKQVTEVARVNGFSTEQLEKSKRQSFESFREFLSEPSPWSAEKWNEELGRHLGETIGLLEAGEDTTKVTAAAVDKLKKVRNQLDLREELHWHDWAMLSKIEASVKSREQLSALKDFAAGLLAHRGLHSDLQAFISQMFELAALAIHEYDRYKKSRGIIDYTDMEVMVNRLLDLKAVQEVLQSEVDLLMVDEFQDTSPLQLEIFLKLSRLSGQAIWVGDPKQSIYGFRGAEPALMEAIIHSQGGLTQENILQHSWRSREDIVALTNAMFTRAFHQLPPAQVALQPVRTRQAALESGTPEPAGMGNALWHWHFEYEGEGRKPGREWFNRCLANVLRAWLEQGIPILPKGEKLYRTAQPGDVAILCRTNSECREVAEALHKAGLQAAIARSGLLETTEVVLILSCLKFILNRYDSLALAEILLLAEGMDLEAMIESRLNFLEDEASGALELRWGEHSHFIGRLGKLRPEVAELSGLETMTLLLEELDLRRIIASWGNSSQRLANVDELCKMARQYEDACNRLHSAASLGGLLLWLGEQSRRHVDFQSSGENPQSVNVLTYHRSKGLEYPVVVCHSLEATLSDELWGISIVPESAEVDLDNLLSNRWLRYWVNPFASQYQKTRLEERIRDSAAKATRQREALAEEARLLYVGITRARDYLILPTRDATPGWLNRVCHRGEEKSPVLDAAGGDSLFEWEGRTLAFKSEIHTFPRDLPDRDLHLTEPHFISEKHGRVSHRPYQIDLDSPWPLLRQQAQLLDEHAYASSLPIPEGEDNGRWPAALLSIYAADNPGNDPAVRLEVVERILSLNELEALESPGSLLDRLIAFRNWMGHQVPGGGEEYRRYPVRMQWKGSFFETSIDHVVMNERGSHLVFNLAGGAQDARIRLKKAREQAIRIAFSVAAISALFPRQPVFAYLHFPQEGLVSEVSVPMLSAT